MRQLQIHVSGTVAARLLELARPHQSAPPRAVPVDGGDGVVVWVELPNDRVGDFIADLARAEVDARCLLLPQDMLSIDTRTPPSPREVRSVTTRSPLELVLAALHSVGSWRSLLLYSCLSGVIAGYALLLDAGYLLIAGMLVAPVGAPVVAAIIGTTTGSAPLLARGILRFVVSVALLVASAAALGLLFGLDNPTALMEQVASLSLGSALVAVVAGVAGAESQLRSDQASLVTATATGFLVAAALSPTSALLGFSLVLHRWDYTAATGLQLGLQFTGLVLGGCIAFAAHGTSVDATPRHSGSFVVRRATPVLGVALLAGLVAVQVVGAASFAHADLSREAGEVARDEVHRLPGVALIQLSARFTTTDREPGQEAMLIEVAVYASDDDEATISPRVRAAIERRVRALDPRLRPFVRVDVLPRPAAG